MDKKYQIIYADPPWRFDNLWNRPSDGGAAKHYKTMSIEEMCALPVKDWVEKDAAMFMWIVQTHIPEALEVIKAWGFKFKTVAFYWVKIKGKQDRLFYAGEDVKMGMGYHTRAGAEQCWLATRGKGYERMTKSEPQVFFSPLREHSRKPDEPREAIVRLCGDLPRLEMFARTARPSWDVWGNETDKFEGAA